VKKFLQIAAAAALLIVGAPANAQNVLAVPVPTVTLYPGDTIGAEQLTERRFRLSSRNMQAVALSRDIVIGKIARRTLVAGQVIPQNAVEDFQLVRRGVPIRVVFAEQGLTIVAYAEPLESGALGEMIRVRNVDTGTIIVGTVQADGSITVGAS
jgi:flagellar basal body P-ring formation protein FlgA